MLKKRQLERIVKGFSNHRRIQILDLLENNPGLSVSEISQSVKSNLKTVSEHTRRLTISGLISKQNQGARVQHTLTPRGIIVLKFLRILE